MSQDNIFYGQIDTLHLFKGDKLILNDTNFTYNSDTVIYVPLGIKYRIKREPNRQTDNFYKSIEEKTSKSKWTKKAYRIIFRPAKNNTDTKETENIKSDPPYFNLHGYAINSIRVNKLDVFGASVNDTALHYVNWFIKTGNNLHLNTHTKIIRNSLLFNEGEYFEPSKIAESERILRSLPYIRDAKIIVIPEKGSKNVDVLVLTQDVWSLGSEIEIKDVNSAVIDIYDKNLGGFGHQLNNRIFYNSKDASSNGYEGNYTLRNQFGNFINSELYYYNRQNVETYRIASSRGFVSPEIKYAGGLRFSQTGLPPVVSYSRNKSLVTSNVRYNYSDVWLARGLDISNDVINATFKTRMIIGGRVIKKNFLSRPEIFADSSQTYYNYTQLMGNIGFAKRNYTKANLIYSYGRTEDIPYGYSVNFVLGTRVDDFYYKYYTGVSASTGNYIDKLGYYYLNLSTGGYLNDRKIEQGIINFQLKYFTPLQQWAGFSMRNFATMNLSYGINRFENEFLDINKSKGIRDFMVDTLNNKNRFVFSIETVNFTPIQILGFRFVMFGFADVATLGNTTDFLFTQKYYTGLGLGLRIRNDNLVFKTFEIKFVYFPELPSDNPNSLFYFSNEQQVKFNDFNISAPGIIPYE